MMVRAFHKFGCHLIESFIKNRERRLYGYMCKGLMDNDQVLCLFVNPVPGSDGILRLISALVF